MAQRHRLLLLTCSVPLVASLVSCGSGSSDTTSGSTAVPAASTVAVGATTTVTGSVTTKASGGATTASSATTGVSSGSSGSSTDTTPKIVDAANAFLATLSASEKSSALFDFSNKAQRQRWSNLPQGLYQRAGLMWGNMNATAQDAWLALMKTTMSTEGYDRVVAEWNADEQLAGQGGSYGIKYYWVAIIGTPSTSTGWQWQWGGHHVTVNATIKGTEVSLTPSFIGVQPSSYATNGTTVRPIGDIYDEAIALMASLDSTQKSKAVLGSTIIDLVLGPGQDGKTIAAEGLAGAAMTDAQKTELLKLIGHYGGLVNDEDAATRMATLKADLDQTSFAWYGPTTSGSGIYFRVTGPHVVIEYSGQSMGGSTANHVHGIYRDPTNDYGAAIGAGL